MLSDLVRSEYLLRMRNGSNHVHGLWKGPLRYRITLIDISWTTRARRNSHTRPSGAIAISLIANPRFASHAWCKTSRPWYPESVGVIISMSRCVTRDHWLISIASYADSSLIKYFSHARWRKYFIDRDELWSRCRIIITSSLDIDGDVIVTDAMMINVPSLRDRLFRKFILVTINLIATMSLQHFFFFAIKKIIQHVRDAADEWLIDDPRAPWLKYFWWSSRRCCDRWNIFIKRTEDDRSIMKFASRRRKTRKSAFLHISCKLQKEQIFVIFVKNDDFWHFSGKTRKTPKRPKKWFALS